MAKYRIEYGSRGVKRFFRVSPGNEPDVEITREEYDEACPNKIEDLLASGITLPGQTPSCWPMQTGLSHGILPHQIEKAMEFDRKNGVPTEYVKTADGYAAHPVFTDRAHRKAYHKSRGCHDNNGGYGD